MMYVRSRYLCGVIALSDAALVSGGVPLERYSWSIASQPVVNAQLVLLLLLANFAMLALLLCGMLSAIVLTRRGVRLTLRHVSRFFARPTRA